MHLKDLKSKNPSELLKIAEELKIENAGTLRKQDMIFAILKQMAFNKEVVGHIINIGPDEEFITINDLAIKIANQMQFNLNPVYTKGRPQEVQLATCSADKARKLLGYQTKTSLDDGLKKMTDYIKKKGTKKFRYHLDLEIVNDLTPDTWRKKLF